MKMKSQPSRRPSKGFSLVEVTLAIGITAVALVSLMGMLPKGMSTLQKATDEAVTGRIHQQIMGEIQLTPWEAESGGGSPLLRFDKQIRYYDDQGIQLSDSERQGNPQSHVYTARVSLPAASGSSGLPKSVGAGSYQGVRLPGETVAGDQWSRLVIVEVTSSQDPRFLENPSSGFDSVVPVRSIYTYRTIISKFGQQFGQ